MRLLIITVASVLFVSTACNKAQKSAGESPSEDSSSRCVYVYQPEFTSIGWTAYKTNERLGVSGSFARFDVNVEDSAVTVKEILHGLKFTIYPYSVNSGDEVRDPKIVKFFFGSMLDSSITGEITSLEFDSTSGIAVISLTMNDTTRDVEAQVSLSDNEVTLETSLDMAGWNATSSVMALNAECKELHTGKDGISILWPDVAVKVKSVLKKACE